MEKVPKINSQKWRLQEEIPHIWKENQRADLVDKKYLRTLTAKKNMYRVVNLLVDSIRMLDRKNMVRGTEMTNKSTLIIIN
jgi:hypothetical protein